MEKRKRYKRQSEKGITLIALIVTIVILAILAGITIKTLTGKNGMIDVTETAAMESKIVGYSEQIEQTVHTEIVAKSTIGEEATTISIAERLAAEDWVAKATVDPTATSTEGTITVIIRKEGFIFQVYYNALYGKVTIDYIGKAEGNGGSNGDDFGNVTDKMPLIYATYDRKTANIVVSVRMPDGTSNGVKSITIYQDGDENKKVGEKTEGIVDNEEYKFPVNESGWYKVVAESKEGVKNSTFVYVSVSEDGLEAPIITVAEAGDSRKDWYGKDKIPVVVEIDTSNSKTSVSGIHYEIISTPAREGDEKVEMKREVFDVTDTKIRLPGITTAGTTKIIAYAKGGNVGRTSDTSVLEVKYDSTAPVLNKINLNGEKKEGFEWYRSDVEVGVQKEDIVEKNSGIDGYWYKRDGSSPVQVQDITKIQTVTKDGTTRFEFKIIDKAGNESAWMTVDVNKDAKDPDKPTLIQTNQTLSSIEVEGRGNDNESDIYSYKFEIRPLNGSNSDWTSPEGATIMTSAGAQRYNFTGKERGEYKGRVVVVDLSRKRKYE